MGETAQHYLIFDTACGACGIAWSGAGISRFQLPDRSAEATERGLLRRLPGAAPGTPPPAVAETVAAVKRYFAGEKVEFGDAQLDLDGQDEFFRQIYAAARRVGWGRTTTYGALAKELGGDWETARDVGQAMAKNPVALIIPCHRVLAAGGKVGGFSAPGGAASKIRMLELEGVRLGAPEPAQQSLGL
jgi:methylated-DNA-[protein]-cysteine S-methyltransferase